LTLSTSTPPHDGVWSVGRCLPGQCIEREDGQKYAAQGPSKEPRSRSFFHN
jgi:hypothetical protein